MAAGRSSGTLLKLLLLLGGMALLALLCCGGIGGGYVYGDLWRGSQRAPYQQGMALLRADAEVLRRIGAPIEDEWPYDYERRVDVDKGLSVADFYAIPVKGPLGSGSLELVAQEDPSGGLLLEARFVDPVTEDSVDLLGRAQEQAVGAEQARVNELFATGEAHESRGALEAALATYDAVLAEEPGHGEARLGRGRVRSAQGDVAGAVADLKLAARQEAVAPEAWSLMGAIHQGQEDWVSCVTAYTERLQLDAEDGDAWYQRARCFEAQGDRRSARAGAREACGFAVAEACAMADRL